MADRLRQVGGLSEVFVDVDGIAPGENFEKKIQAMIARSEVFVVVIGSGWMGGDKGGSPRLLDPSDYVRMETAEALRQSLRIIPVLANGAVMPSPDGLPEDLQALTKLNALSVRHTDFDHDVDRLINAILERSPSRPRAGYASRRTPQSIVLRAVIGALIGGAVLMTMAVANNLKWHTSLETTLGGSDMVIVVIVAVVAAGAIAGAFYRRR